MVIFQYHNNMISYNIWWQNYFYLDRECAIVPGNPSGLTWTCHSWRVVWGEGEGLQGRDPDID